MLKQISHLICLSGLLYAPLLNALEIDSALTLSSQWAISSENGDSQSLRVTIEPELSIDFDNHWQLFGSAKLRSEAINGLQLNDQIRDSNSVLSQPALLSDVVELELSELYIQGEMAETFIKLGKQQIVWGKSDGLKVLDIVNPQSFREFILDDYDDSRMPLWTLNIEHRFADWDVQFIWMPDPSYHQLPDPSARYAFTSPALVPSAPDGVAVRLDTAQRPNHLLLDSDVGLRLATFWQGWDIIFNYLYQYNNLPVLRQRLSLQNGTPTVTVSPQYERTHVFGTTFSNAFDDWVVRGEIGYFSAHYFINQNSQSNQGVVKSPELHYVLGLDWNAPLDILFSVQMIQSWILEDANQATRDQLDTTFTALLRKHYLYDTLTTEVLFIANSNNGKMKSPPGWQQIFFMATCKAYLDNLTRMTGCCSVWNWLFKEPLIKLVRI